MKQHRQTQADSGSAAHRARCGTRMMMALLLCLMVLAVSAPIALYSATPNAVTADVLRAPYTWRAPPPATADILRGPYGFVAPASQASVADVLRSGYR